MAVIEQTYEGTEQVARGQARATRAASAPQPVSTPLPLARRTPRGTLRWYLVRCPEGQEASTCERVRRTVPVDLLQDAFVPRRENQFKFHGEWRTEVVALFRGYFVVATMDAPALSRALARLSFPVRMAGAVGRGYQPMDRDAQEFLSEVMDPEHVVRLSSGEIADDVLRVDRGPLVGREKRVSRYNRRRSIAFVRVGEGDGGDAQLVLPLAILARR